jgi:tetratricopeptide (TPR) repeat protein
MRCALIALALYLLPVSAQEPISDLDCVTTIGEISYPAYEWGFHQAGSTRVLVQLGADGRPASVGQAGIPSQFGVEARRSALASTYKESCRDRKLTITYRFEFGGEPSVSPAVSRHKENARILVAGQPPSPTCDTEADSDDAALWHAGRADRLLNDRRYPEALVCAEKGLLRRPIATAYIAKGVALRKLGRLSEAIATYDELEKLEPLHHQLFFNRANAYRDSGDKEAAIRDFTTAIDMMDEPGKAYLNRGNLYLGLRRLTLARNDYQMAAELDPTDASAQNNLCSVLTELRSEQEAFRVCNRAIDLDGADPGPYNNRAILWMNQQKFEEAIRDSSAAIRLEPRAFENHFTRGTAYMMAGRLEEALVDLTEAIRLRPESGESYVVRAALRRSLGDTQGGASDEQTAARLGTTAGMTSFVFDPVTGRSKPIH